MGFGFLFIEGRLGGFFGGDRKGMMLLYFSRVLYWVLELRKEGGCGD